jgi:futalosine hydrolase
MHILIVSATYFEVKPIMDAIGASLDKETMVGKHSINFLHTGVGMTQTAYVLTKRLHKPVDLVINAGIAGAFYKGIDIGEVVEVVSDCIIEMGAEDGDTFLEFAKLNLPGTNSFENVVYKQTQHLSELKKARGATVNKVHGNEGNIVRLLKQFDVEIESMEGAAVALVCEQEKIPYIQLRAISNYVTKRNRDTWDIPLAVKNLNDVLFKILKEIE